MTDEGFFEKIDAAMVSYRLLTDEQRQSIAELISSRGITYEHALYQCANVDPATYKRILEEVSGCVVVDPSQIVIDQRFIEAIVDVLPIAAIAGLKIFPVSLSGNELTVAMANPTDSDLIAELQSTTCYRVRPVATTLRGVQPAIERSFSHSLRGVLQQISTAKKSDILAIIHAERQRTGIDGTYERFVTFVNREFERARREPAELPHMVNHPVVVSYTQRMLADLISHNCSDIHVEPHTGSVRIRARMNGVLRTVHELPRQCGEVVSMRIRTMAGLPIEDPSSPLDGQINYSPVYGRRLEFRVSVLPTIHGAKTVLRVLEKQNQSASLEHIGMTPSELEIVRRNIAAPNGLILVTGPTGSGKTSTLYSIVSILNDDERCIVTAEEPVESEITGVVQVACGQDCSFATALRAFLRQDPDVIMVGEIRDQETADIALKAALTGHLVLSTLHTNDSATAVSRLLNLGMDPFVVASSLRVVIAQRLIRTLCDECKSAANRSEVLRRFNPAEVPSADQLFKARGCALCNQSGYRGRIGIFEILQSSDDMAAAISRNATAAEIRSVAARGGTQSLRQRALALCAEGRTTVDEVIRVTAE